jgi:hypothetical protein
MGRTPIVIPVRVTPIHSARTGNRHKRHMSKSASQADTTPKATAITDHIARTETKNRLPDLRMA